MGRFRNIGRYLLSAGAAGLIGGAISRNSKANIERSYARQRATNARFFGNHFAGTDFATPRNSRVFGRGAYRVTRNTRPKVRRGGKKPPRRRPARTNPVASVKPVPVARRRFLSRVGDKLISLGRYATLLGLGTGVSAGVMHGFKTAVEGRRPGRRLQQAATAVEKAQLLDYVGRRAAIAEAKGEVRQGGIFNPRTTQWRFRRPSRLVSDSYVNNKMDMLP